MSFRKKRCIRYVYSSQQKVDYSVLTALHLSRTVLRDELTALHQHSRAALPLAETRWDRKKFRELPRSHHQKVTKLHKSLLTPSSAAARTLQRKPRHGSHGARCHQATRKANTALLSTDRAASDERRVEHNSASASQLQG